MNQQNNVRYVTQKDWDTVQSALAAVLRVADNMPEGHHRESIRNIVNPVHVPVEVSNG